MSPGLVFVAVSSQVGDEFVVVLAAWALLSVTSRRAPPSSRFVFDSVSPQASAPRAGFVGDCFVEAVAVSAVLTASSQEVPESPDLAFGGVASALGFAVSSDAVPPLLTCGGSSDLS